MSYTVSWTPLAQNQLAGLWLDATERDRLTEAANSLDESLQYNPHEQGESRFSTLRIVFAFPLACYVDVRQDDLSVYVLAVWRTD